MKFSELVRFRQERGEEGQPYSFFLCNQFCVRRQVTSHARLDFFSATGTMRHMQTVKTYTFKVVVEPDEDRWHAYCPALEQYGAATWGNTEEDALRHINEVVQMIVEELVEDGEPIPEGPQEEVAVFSDTRVAVTV